MESSIAEAQEWEYKLIAVQDWLTDRDVVLSSHLEHELTVDDLPDESQVCVLPSVLNITGEGSEKFTYLYYCM